MLGNGDRVKSPPLLLRAGPRVVGLSRAGVWGSPSSEWGSSCLGAFSRHLCPALNTYRSCLFLELIHPAELGVLLQEKALVKTEV